MAAALSVVVPFYSWAQGPASLQAEFDVYLPAAFDSAGTVLAKTQRAKKPLIDWDVLLQGIHEDFYTYTSIGLVKNMDTSKFKYPDWGFNSLFGFSWGCFGFYLGADFFDLFSSGSGISVISVFTLGLPLKIFVFTVKPYIGIGADVFSIINAHDYSNYEPDSDNPLSVFGADFELGIQVISFRCIPAKNISF